MIRDRILLRLKKRKEELSIPYEAIAKKSQVGIATVKRVFKGDDVSISKIEKIAEALGMDDDLKPKISATKMLRAEIERKALEVSQRVVHSSSLESQTPSTKALEIINKELIKKISAMPKTKIWQ